MLKKLLGSLLIGTLVLGTAPAAFAADGITYAVNETFNIPDNMNGPSDHTYASDDRPWLIEDRCQVIAVGADSLVGIENGALTFKSLQKKSTVRYFLNDNALAGDKVAFEFLFSIDKMMGLDTASNAITIADSTSLGNKVTEVRLARKTGAAGNPPVFLQVTSDDGAGTDVNTQLEVPISGGDNIFVRFEMDFGADREEQGSFTVYVRNLDTGISQKSNSLYMIGDRKSSQAKGYFPVDIGQLEFNMYLGYNSGSGTTEQATATIDDVKIYDATNGYAPEPVYSNRVNIVRGLTLAQLEKKSQATDSSNASRAFDGVIDDNSRWLTAGTAEDEYLIMNLPEAKTFDSARICSGAGAFTTLKNFWLEYDNGENDWVKIDNTEFTTIRGAAGNVYLRFEPITASRIKLVINEKTAVRLRELEIYEADSNYPPANVSIHDDMTATADIYYYNAADMDAAADTIKFLAAYYDGDAFAGIEEITVTEGLTNYHGSNSVTFTVPAGEAGQTVRLFYWDSLGSLRPLANAAEITTPAA